MAATYDFVVVGAGISGTVVASRLANTPARPSVLLIEAGGDNSDSSYMIPAERFTLAFTKPELNWGYKTEPQSHLKGQQIDYGRGRGLGGSSAINFCAWVVGPDEDYDEWAKLVKDESFNWSRTKERLKKIERLNVKVPEEYSQYIAPNPQDHGTNGPVDLSYGGDEWEKDLGDVFEAAKQSGLGTNADINNGNPIGLGMASLTMKNGNRVTSTGAYLANIPSNLTIVLNAPIAKVILSGKRAAGVETVDGRKFFANLEVVLSGGALNSPQLLLLSGIGPADELKKHGIPVLHELSQVGKNLQDHCFSTATLIQQPGTNGRALKMANKDQRDASGLMFNIPCPMGWFKVDSVYKSSEFRALPTDFKEFLLKPTEPLMEICTHMPPLFTGDYQLQPDDSYLTAGAYMMNPLSRGEVTLNSANPLDAPKIDPKFLSHPFDRRVLIDSMRSLLDLLEAPALAKSTVKMVGCPKDRSDESIWEHISANLFSSWHMCSTVRMGTDQKDACVDSSFKVFGLENFRVVDLSVCPLLPNNHTQSTAYLVGEAAAEKMINEFQLQGKKTSGTPKL